MSRVWSEARRLQHWLDVELAVTAAREARGEAPPGVSARLRERIRLDADRMATIEAEVGHDVIAFLSMVAETAGDDARHLHVGLTSSDVVDTALALQLREAGTLLLEELGALRVVVWELAERHRRTPMIGRTHGVHAEPITFGLKCLGWSEELGRDAAGLEDAVRGCAVGKCSGAVGTLAYVDPAVEVEALRSLGLTPEPVATQVVSRDRHAAILARLALLGGTLERIALEIRHLQRSEVREVEEPFAERQKGSSAMPHKRNPVRCERVCGLSRLLRGYALAGMENQALWHERDISHSSAERVILPDAFLVADFMVAELTAVLSGLRVHPETMRRNLDAGGGLVFSQRVLLDLTAAGLARDEAYRLVQLHALAALDGEGSFRARLEADPRVRAVLPPDRLAACFDLEATLRNVDALFARATAPPGRSATARSAATHAPAGTTPTAARPAR
jgi:adenylosuccinate lyase